MVTREMVLDRLPPFRDEWLLVTPDQYVPDIIRDISHRHRQYGRYYDLFSYLFYTTDAGLLTETLYDFCKSYIDYREEKKEMQTTAVPQGILSRGYGDCKHFALFNAGVVASLNRVCGCCFEGSFMFVGYEGAKEPYHVFVRVLDRGSDTDIWIDPTPGSSGGLISVVEERKL